MKGQWFQGWDCLLAHFVTLKSRRRGSVRIKWSDFVAGPHWTQNELQMGDGRGLSSENCLSLSWLHTKPNTAANNAAMPIFQRGSYGSAATAFAAAIVQNCRRFPLKFPQSASCVRSLPPQWSNTTPNHTTWRPTMLCNWCEGTTHPKSCHCSGTFGVNAARHLMCEWWQPWF